MFNRRLKVLFVILSFAAVLVVGRLVDLQVARTEELRRQAAESMTRPIRLVPAVRGRILDRYGQVLACDSPQWELCAYYPALVDDERAEQMWQLTRRLTGLSRDEFAKRRSKILRRVQAIHADVSRKAGIDTEVAEERMFHPVVWGLDDQEAVALRLQLLEQPQAAIGEVRVSNRRTYRQGESVCHILGTLGSVPSEVLYGSDNRRADVLKQYRLGDLMGYSAAERLGEQLLRGRRGFVRQDMHGQVVESVGARRGGDLYLTLDLALQEQVLKLLSQAVRANESARSFGAAAVVLEVETREVLALVSYPTFDIARRAQMYRELAGDRRGAPLLFRAVSGTYPPGSVVKPIVLAAALSLGVLDPDEKSLCTGRLFEGVNGWHCWTHWRGMPGHGWLDASDAIKHSCNVYFYKAGQAVGAERLVDWFGRFGLGRYPGTGLVEERAGIVPTQLWLREHRRRSFRIGDSRNLAIGQGDLTATPLQIANLAATIASGRWQAPTVLMNDRRDRPVEVLPVSAAHWAVIREGMYRVVNERGGTAYKTARLDGLEMCGKTGSAQTGRPGTDTHAWFMGYAPYRRPKVAVVVLIEHGGSGGRVAGPVAKRIMQAIMDSPHGYLSDRVR